MADSRRTPRRPAMLSPDEADALVGAPDPALQSEWAHLAAAAVCGRVDLAVAGAPADAPSTTPAPVPRAWGMDPDAPALTLDVEAVERIRAMVRADGVDSIAELWMDSPAASLPGVLWRLHLLDQWMRRDEDLVAPGLARAVDALRSELAPEGAVGEGLVRPDWGRLRAELDATFACAPLGASSPVPPLAGVVTHAASLLAVLARDARGGDRWIEDPADPLAHAVTLRPEALSRTSAELLAGLASVLREGE